MNVNSLGGSLTPPGGFPTHKDVNEVTGCPEGLDESAHVTGKAALRREWVV